MDVVLGFVMVACALIASWSSWRGDMAAAAYYMTGAIFLLLVLVHFGGAS